MSVRSWDVDSELQLSNWQYTGPVGEGQEPFQYPIRLDWSPDNSHLAIGTLREEGDDGAPIWDGHVYVVKVQSGSTILKYNVGGRSHRAEVQALAWRPDGKAILVGTTLGVIEAVTVDSGRVIFSHPLHSTCIRSLAWSHDGKRIATAAEDGSVKVINGDSGVDLLTFPLSDEAHYVAWSHDDRCLAAGTRNGQIQVWNASRAYEFSTGKDRRGELARSYIDSHANDYDLRLREGLRLAPDSLDCWSLRGHTLAKLGDLDGAVREFAKTTKPKLQWTLGNSTYYGLALLGTEKLDAYREHCVAMLSEFENTQVPSTARRLAWLCALIPTYKVDSKQLYILSHGRTEPGGFGLTNAELVQGACLFRDGKFQEAVDVLNEVSTKFARMGDPSQRHRLTYALLFLAMARHQLGHEFQAKRHLDEATQLILEISSNVDWSQRVELRVLERETRELISP